MDVNKILLQVEKHRGDWPALAREAGVTYSWLTKFAAKTIPGPRIVTLQKLEAALNARDPA